MIFLQISEMPIIDMILEQIAKLMNVLPGLIGAVVVLVIGWIIAKIGANILTKFLSRIGIDKLADKLNEIDIIDKSNVNIKPSAFIAKIFYYLVIFIFAMVATEVLGMEPITELMTNFMNYIPKVLVAIVVFVVGILIADAIKKMVLTAAESLAIPAAKVIANVTFYFLFINIIMISLKQAEMETDFIETNISILLGGIVLAFAIGYGLASKEMMMSLLSSFYRKQSIEIGDEIGLCGERGIVIEKDKSTITIETKDSKVIIPLSKLTNEKLEIFNK